MIALGDDVIAPDVLSDAVRRGGRPAPSEDADGPV